MSKLVVVIMGQNCENTIQMCLDSVKDADVIVYCDGGSEDETTNIVGEVIRDRDGDIISNEYDQEDKKMNGKQRNFYLKYLKKNYPDDWALCLDADEVVGDFGILNLKQAIKQIEEIENPITIYCPIIHHFIGDLGHEDDTRPVHFALNRFFKVTKDLEYPETEHPVLKGDSNSRTIEIHLWHLRECLGVLETKKKFESNVKKSQMHSQDQLKQWNRDMLLGNYPIKKVHYDLLPFPIKNYFNLNI